MQEDSSIPRGRRESNLTGGKLVGTAQSNTLEVLPAQTVDLAAYYTPPASGAFIVTEHVEYANKVTKIKRPC